MSCARARLNEKGNITRLPGFQRYLRVAYTAIAGASLLFFNFLFPLLFQSIHDSHPMAEKEATVYIVDVGRSMGERHHGRSITDLEWAMQYVWDKITTTVRVFSRFL